MLELRHYIGFLEVICIGILCICRPIMHQLHFSRVKRMLRLFFFFFKYKKGACLTDLRITALVDPILLS